MIEKLLSILACALWASMAWAQQALFGGKPDRISRGKRRRYCNLPALCSEGCESRSHR